MWLFKRLVQKLKYFKAFDFLKRRKAYNVYCPYPMALAVHLWMVAMLQLVVAMWQRWMVV